MKKSILFCGAMLSLVTMTLAQKQVSLNAADGLEITADLYEVDPVCQMVILCHQAGWSRGEYRETAKWLNTKNFNCLAIDQRSGEGVNDVNNETAARAKQQGKGQSYLDAEQDIVAAVHWAQARTGRRVVLVGSSYSASLVLKIAMDMDEVMGVAAFSPGEYFGAKLKLGKAIDGLATPTFITASKAEMPKAQLLANHVQPRRLTTYVPTEAGFHGSRALWTTNEGHEGYRKAFLEWLEKFRKY